jgi:hypothetical protein
MTAAIFLFAKEKRAEHLPRMAIPHSPNLKTKINA